MNKKYIFIGVAFSLALHTAFFTLPRFIKMEEKGAVKKGEKKCPVTARIPEVQEEVKMDRNENNAATRYEIKKKQIQGVFKPPSAEVDIKPEEKGNIKLAEPDEEYMPALRIDISDYGTMVGAIRYFGMRVALLDGLENFVDEIKLGRYPEIAPITEGLEEYSNRTRILPSGYFGEKITGILRLRGLKACILVPADVDRKFAELQEHVIASRGRTKAEVSATDGRFIKDGEKYNLIIEKVYLKEGREDAP